MKGMIPLILLHDPLTHDGMVEYNNSFLEHFTDHLQSAFAFLLLGFILAIMYVIRLHNRKFRIDYELEKSTIMRVYSNGRKWLIVNPQTTMEWFDIIFLIHFDSKKNRAKYVDKQDRRRIRKVSIIVLTLLSLAIIWGIIMLFSASDTDINPFNWLRGYRPWI